MLFKSDWKGLKEKEKGRKKEWKLGKKGEKRKKRMISQRFNKKNMRVANQLSWG